jgi:hypothetical protein
MYCTVPTTWLNSVKSLLLGHPDLAHPALADFLEQLVGADHSRVGQAGAVDGRRNLVFLRQALQLARKQRPPLVRNFAQIVRHERARTGL